LCFERRHPKQNSVICLKSNSLYPSNFSGPSQIFGLATLLIDWPLPNKILDCTTVGHASCAGWYGNINYLSLSRNSVIEEIRMSNWPPGADTGGMHPPTRPKEVLTWHLISLKIIAKIFCTAHYLNAKDAKN